MRSTSQCPANSNEQRICIANTFSANNKGFSYKHDQSIDWRSVLDAYDRIGRRAGEAKAKDDTPAQLFEHLYLRLKCALSSRFKRELVEQKC